MTAMLGSSSYPPVILAATRRGLHRVAEHVLAAALYAATGEIGLVPSPGGFRTTAYGPDGRSLAVDGAWLIAGSARGTRRTALTTLRAAAEFAGVTPGAPAHVYRPATPLDLDEPLAIDSFAAHLLAEWFALGAQALGRFAAESPGDESTSVVLWPEHFDVGITAATVNYGASPGDDQISDPYVYVGPHAGPPPGDPGFWNVSFGAARTFHQIGTVPEAAAFFHDGRARVRAHTAAADWVSGR